MQEDNIFKTNFKFVICKKQPLRFSNLKQDLINAKLPNKQLSKILSLIIKLITTSLNLIKIRISNQILYIDLTMIINSKSFLIT